MSRPDDGEEDLDPRFTLANERTMLAWNRTALALVSAGAAAAAFLDDLGTARLAVALPLILLGTAVALVGYRRWVVIERAMRRREPLPDSPWPRILGGGVALVAVVVAVLAVAEVL